MGRSGEARCDDVRGGGLASILLDNRGLNWSNCDGCSTPEQHTAPQLLLLAAIDMFLSEC